MSALFFFVLGAVTCWITLYLVGQWLIWRQSNYNDEEQRLVDDLPALPDWWRKQ